ncbi:beta-L-arabinofuranosidase domain-containing protein [Oceanispirochaeta sp.]|jgi:DUF1680 family protein|uniref:glycoside hydrolase family 127 protein n=1 Tax=Oceanispirochaeta sp. TaxID=2035350 RepID=UPI002633AA00|nr:beta-L-arabinofuranosidase domain-containing protein [Oceanispirochaeta sp.]MDA3957091.1 glycoside hydrolase family 127 protein [Oceanispirochaeta sp.]
MQKGYFHSLPLSTITIHDPLFSHYVQIISDSAIPYQWEILNDRIEGVERSHCLENFRIAAGEKNGNHYGTVFLDSDAYKWLEAVAYCIESGNGDHLIENADKLIDIIANAQQQDGYLNTYFTIKYPDKRWTNLLEGHELYCAGHLIEAAVAYYTATGKKILLDTACRFADLISQTFGPEEGQHPGYPGHQEIELALVKLYRITQKSSYLDTAKHFISQRGHEDNYFYEEIERREGKGIFPEFSNYNLKYSQTHMPPVQQDCIEGHAVRAMYMCSAMADLAQECGDADLANAAGRLWSSTTEKRMYITGGVGSSGFLERFTVDYDLPSDTTYCETCASVGLMMFGQRMASLTGNASYYDIVEKALFNTVLAGISADGRQYFYVNPLEVWPENCLASTSMGHVKPVRQDWYSVACCPTNIARTLASLGQYIYASDGHALFINQFISSSITLQENDNSVRMDADLFKKGSVTITADSAVRIHVRIPRYFKNVAYQINGRDVFPETVNGYACLELPEGGAVVIGASVEPVWISSNDEVRANSGKAALTYGPLIYCLEETDNRKNLASFYINPEYPVRRAEEMIQLPGELPFLEYEGVRIENGVSQLYGSPDYRIIPEKIRAVPYSLWCNRTPGEMIVWQKVRI